MEKLKTSIFIEAPVEKVWHTMLDDATYRIWTKHFNPTSFYEGDWSKGSKILFLGTNEEGKVDGGMVSRIAENKEYEFVSIEHLGIINNGVEDTTSEEVKKWTPAFENYTFIKKDNGTEVLVEMDVNEEYKGMFEQMWPKALEELKKLSENS